VRSENLIRSRASAQAQRHRRHRQLPAHKVPGVREAIEARGATLRYPTQYSPELNPIEMPFSKLKAYLRRAAERTVPRLYRRIGSFARSLTAREARNYFRHAGYA
jgi:transposase